MEDSIPNTSSLNEDTPKPPKRSVFVPVLIQNDFAKISILHAQQNVIVNLTEHAHKLSNDNDFPVKIIYGKNKSVSLYNDFNFIRLNYLDKTMQSNDRGVVNKFNNHPYPEFPEFIYALRDFFESHLFQFGEKKRWEQSKLASQFSKNCGDQIGLVQDSITIASDKCLNLAFDKSIFDFEIPLINKHTHG